MIGSVEVDRVRWFSPSVVVQSRSCVLSILEECEVVWFALYGCSLGGGVELVCSVVEVGVVACCQQQASEMACAL